MTLFLGGVDFMNNVDCLFLSKHLHTNTEIYSGLYKDSSYSDKLANILQKVKQRYY